MIDPISTTANTVSIIDRIVAAVSWFGRNKQKKSPLFPNYSEQLEHDFELRPISFRIDLLCPVPQVELHFYAVNYLKRRLTLITPDTHVEHVTCGSMIDQIPLYQEYTLDPKSTSQVIFRRKLLDSETRLLAQTQLYTPLSASFSLRAKAKGRRKEYVYGPVSSRSIEGWINKK